jgi:Flp pilus assembly pilin Flp
VDAEHRLGARPANDFRGKGDMTISQATRSLRRDDGQALVEYALILFFVAIVCITVLTALGAGVRDVLQSIVTGL